MASPVLETQGLRKSFGGLTAVDGIDVQIQPQTIVGLIGPNGAGKTTLFDLISGFLRPDAGTIRFGGERIDALAPHRRANKGVVKTFQIPHELTGMTTRENLCLAAQDHPGEAVLPALLETASVRTAEQELMDRAQSWIDRLELTTVADEYAGNLSGGQKKLLELGRAMMTDPDLLLLDEPLAGVNPDLSESLLSLIEDLRTEHRRSILIVEHDMDAIFALCDEIIGMHNGSVLIQDAPEIVREDEEVMNAYLGDR